MGVAHQHENAAPAEVAAPAPEAAVAGPVAPVPMSAMVVGHAEDHAEADADRRADVALARLRRRSADDGSADGTSAALDQHRHGPGCDHVRRAAGPSADAEVGREGGPLNAATSSRIDSRRGSGTALPDGVKGRMEQAFGTSLAGVRIHTDESAATLNRTVSARAFTTGNDIFFGAGEFAPDTDEGERVLAHELAHTMQPAEAIHRLPWDSKETKEKKKTEKEKKDAQAKALKAAKELEKTEAAQLKQSRTEGVAMRGGLKGKASTELDTERAKMKDAPVQQRGDAMSGPVNQIGKAKLGSDTHTSMDGVQFQKTSAGGTITSLTDRFEAALKRETALSTLLTTKGHDAESAAEAAYQLVWVDTLDKELKAVRPPRETASERLASSVRATRGEENSQLKRGELLSAELEKVYEAWEVKTLELMTGPPAKARDAADVEAGVAVWQLAGDTLRGKRPSDPALERLARGTAKVRTANGLKPPADVVTFLASKTGEKSNLEKASGLGETIGGIADPILTGIGGVGKGVGAIGGKLDNKLQSGIAQSVDYSDATKVPVVGEFAKSIENVQHAKATGVSDTSKFVGKDSTGKDLPTSTTTQAAQGMGTVTSVLSDLISGANNAMKMVQAVKEAIAEKKTAKILAATKACADAGGSIATLGKDTANLAKLIDPGVAQSVGSVIPGFNIAIAVMSLVSNSVDLATTGMSLSNNNQNLTDARLRTPNAKKVDVLVYPLLHTTAAATKKFEQAVWSTGQSVSALVTSIATVASAGGFGIPAAVDAGMKLLNLLHKVGHLIAENVLAVLAQRSREASAGALEGAAEGQMKADPSMAVDGITMQARKGDLVALNFLKAYGFPTKDDVTAASLTDVRTAVLAELGEDADPKTTYQSYKAKVGGMLTKWSETGALAEKRNVDGKDRGVFWRIKMALRSDADHNRSKNKTTALAKSTVECRVGSLVVYADATTAEKLAFLDALAKVDLPTMRAAVDDAKNSPEWRARISEIHQELLAKARKPAGAGVAP